VTKLSYIRNGAIIITNIILVIGYLLLLPFIRLGIFFLALDTSFSFIYIIPYLVIGPIVLNILVLHWISIYLDKLSSWRLVVTSIFIFILFPIAYLLNLSKVIRNWIKAKVTSLIFISVLITFIIICLEVAIFIPFFLIVPIIVVVNIVIDLIFYYDPSRKYKNLFDNDVIEYERKRITIMNRLQRAKNIVFAILLTAIISSIIFIFIFRLNMNFFATVLVIFLMLIPIFLITRYLINFVFFIFTPRKHHYYGLSDKVGIDKPTVRIKKARRLDLAILKTIFGISFYLILFGLSIMGLIFLLVNTSGGFWNIFMTILLFIGIIYLGLVSFFEIIMHFKFSSSKNKLSKFLNNISTNYRKRRDKQFLSLIGVIIGSFFLAIGTLLATYIATFDINVIDNLAIPKATNIVLGIFFLPIGYILSIGSVAFLFFTLIIPGYITKKPLQGFLAGLLNGVIYGILLLLLGFGGSLTPVLLIVGICACPYFGYIGGLLAWIEGGSGFKKRERKQKRKSKRANKEVKVSANEG
jgi:hypothetical protein